MQEKFKNIFPRNRFGQELTVSLEKHMAEFGILDTLHRQAGFLANVYVETMGLTSLEEDLYYSAERLSEVWPNRYEGSDGEPNKLALQLSENPEGLGNHTYANRMGNGTVESGDGYRYRGRGCKMITGKAMYSLFDEDSRFNFPFSLTDQPDKVSQNLELAAITAVWYWDIKSINKIIDRGNFRKACYVINGGYHGYGRRESQYERVLKILKS